MNWKLITLILCISTVFAGCSQSTEKPKSNTAAVIQKKSSGVPLPLKIKGNQILNSKDEPVLLRGVNAAALEWSSDGEGHIVETVRVAIDDWNSNIVRIPLTQDRWFGKAPEQNDSGIAYRAIVKQIVDMCASKGCYIILDLHWSDTNEWGQNIGQHSMPDRNSLIFWKDCAAVYANHPAVLFDLYNEPHDITWDVWLNGGMIKDRPSIPGVLPKNFEAVGMQEMLHTIRSTGAKNVIIAGGIDWAYDFNGILEDRQLKDPTGSGVIYANHAYDHFGETIPTWIANMKRAAAVFPIIISEFGASGGPNRRNTGWWQSPSNATGDDWLLHLMRGIEDNKWSFVAWDLHTAAGPTLIADWNYMPTPDFGVYVKQLLVTGTVTPRYNPPDLSKINEGLKSTLPVSARMGGKVLYGDWLIKSDPCGPGASILFLAGDSEGRLAGYWINPRGLAELQDIRFKDNAVTFSMAIQFKKDSIPAYFSGTLDGNRVSGTLVCGANKSRVGGNRKPAISIASGATDVNAGLQLTGIWILNAASNWGSTQQRLKINPDMSGMYGVSPIDKITLEGDKVSFKVTAGMRYETTFECKLEGSTLTGLMKTSRDTIEVTGKKTDFVF
jgi:hypothetical protein